MASYPLPPTDLYHRQLIRFLHPGYEVNNTLLYLPRVDHKAPAATTFGVHCGTALIACQIIAGNAFEHGRLTLDQAGRQLASQEFDEILTESVYYFRIDNGPDQYPIVPSFQDWEFPHDGIPDSWPEVSTKSLNTHRRCGISNFSFAIDRTHLIPKDEAVWYRNNDMGRYDGSVVSDLSHPINIIQLKTDLHRCFDNRWFAIVPKDLQTMTPHSPQYVTHLLFGEAAELWPAYHNIIAQYLHPQARPYLFARFAWAILLQVKRFITSGYPRHVVRVHLNEQGKPEYKAELLSGPQLQDLYGGGGSKGTTPKKRARADSPADSEGGEVDMDDEWDDTMGWWQKPEKETRKQLSGETVAEEDNRAQRLAELKTQLEDILPGGGHDIPEEEEY